MVGCSGSGSFQPFVEAIVVEPYALGTVPLGVYDYELPAPTCQQDFYCRFNGVIANNSTPNAVAFDVYSHAATGEWYAEVQDVGGQGFTMQVKCDPNLLIGSTPTYIGSDASAGPERLQASATASAGSNNAECTTLTTNGNAHPSVAGFVGVIGAENGGDTGWVQWDGSEWQVCAKSYPGGPDTKVLANARLASDTPAWTGSPTEHETSTTSNVEPDGTSYPNGGCDYFVVAAPSSNFDWSAGYPVVGPVASPNLAYFACTTN